MISEVINITANRASDESTVSVTSGFFQRHLKTTTVIDATPERVYARMTDLKAYHHWSPLFRSIRGELKQGCRLNIVIELKETGIMKIKPQIINLEHNRELRWIGRLLCKGLFDGEHYFTLEQNQSGQTTLHHGEKFSGLFVPLLWRILRKGTTDSFLAHNNSLKQLVEIKDK